MFNKLYKTYFSGLLKGSHLKRIRIIFVFFLLYILMSCAPLQILPGLCYTDKTGTYVCIDEASAQPMTDIHMAVEEEKLRKDLLDELQQRAETFEEIMLYLQTLEEFQRYYD